MTTTKLPIITSVTHYSQYKGLTTIYFNYIFFDGQGIRSEDFQINDYEMSWYYTQLGLSKRYSPFKDFWENSAREERLSFLYLLVADAKSVVSMNAKAKIRKNTSPSEDVTSIRALFRRLAS